MIVSNQTKLDKLLGTFEKTAAKLMVVGSNLQDEATADHNEGRALLTRASVLETQAETAYRAAAKIRALIS